MKKNLILASVLTIGFSGLTIGSVANADVTSVNGGSENVDGYNGLVRSEVSDNPNTQHGTALRAITKGKKDGGYWIRGTSNGYTVSSYKHYSKLGNASVVSSSGRLVSGGWKKAGIFSTARIKGNGKAYYKHS